jgi:hypothetical protein
VLTHVEVEKSQADEEHEKAVQEKIMETVRQYQGQLTPRKLRDTFTQQWKNEGLQTSKGEVEGMINMLLLTHDLFLIERKNAQNKTFEYLSTTPAGGVSEECQERSVEECSK